MAQSTITCHCGAVNFEVDIDLPAVSELCHCNPCRLTSGALFEAFVPLPSRPPAEALEQCTAFASSDDHNRYFCSTCGTKTFIQVHRPGEERWTALSGAIDPPDGTQNVNKIHQHEFVGDAGDGGVAPLMTKIGGRDVPSFNTSDSKGEEFSNQELIQLAKKADSLAPLDKDALLTAECRCGGVSLRIHKADHKATDTPARFTPSGENDRYTARACVCRDCRLHQGVTTAFWWYLPYASVINPHTNLEVAHCAATQTEEGKKANQGLNLTHYMRPAKDGDWDSYRAFCKTCGASVFYDFSDRPTVTNIAAGLVKAEEGIMARRWVSWEWGATSHPDSYIDQEIRDAWMSAEGTNGVPQL
jgi:hypothetical protein